MMKFIRREHLPTDRRPRGYYWLAAIEGPLRGAFAVRLDAAGPTRLGRGRGRAPHRGHPLKRGLA